MDDKSFGSAALGSRMRDMYPPTRNSEPPTSAGPLTVQHPSNSSLTAMTQLHRSARLPSSTGSQRFILSTAAQPEPDSGCDESAHVCPSSPGGDPAPLSAETLRGAGFPFDLARYLLACLADDCPLSRSDVDALLRAQTVVDETRAAFPFGRSNVKGDDRSGPLRYALNQYHLSIELLDRRANGAPEFVHLANVDDYYFLRGIEAAGSSFMGAGRCESFTDVAAAKMDVILREGESAQRAFSKNIDHAWLQFNRSEPESSSARPEPVVIDAWAGPHPVLARHGEYTFDSSAVHLEREMNRRDIGLVAACADAAFAALKNTTTVEETLEVTWEGGDPDDPEAPASLNDLIETPGWDEPSVINRAWAKEVLGRPENANRRRMTALAVIVARAVGVLPEAAPFVAEAIVDAVNGT